MVEHGEFDHLIRKVNKSWIAATVKLTGFVQVLFSLHGSASKLRNMKRHAPNKYSPLKMVKEIVGYPLKFNLSKPNADHFKFELKTGNEKLRK